MSDDETPHKPDDRAGLPCPVPLAHERFDEAHWFLHQMMEHYHEPMLFRFNVNAFLSALKSVLSMLIRDLESAEHKAWREVKLRELNTDPLFRAFSQGRDLVVHRGRLVANSQVEMGRFKYYKLAFVLQRDLHTDLSSEALLRRLQTADKGDGFFIGGDRSFIGEQLGVRRLYFEPKLSSDKDVFTAAHEAWLKVGLVLGEAHERFGVAYDADPVDVGDVHSVERMSILLETDVQPELLKQWGWDS